MTTTDAERWDRWIQSLEGSNLRQASGYGRALTMFGQRSELLTTKDGEDFAAGALLGIRDSLPGLGPAVHTSGGVATRDPYDPLVLRRFLQALVDRSRELGASTVDVFLRVPQRVGDDDVPNAGALKRALGETGFHLREPFDTYYIDLCDRTEDALLSAFGKNPRRHIRKAKREGLVVERSLALQDFRDFEEAHRAMTRRKGLTTFPAGFLSDAIFRLASEGLGNLFVARHGGTPRNYALVSSVGGDSYLWGALAEAAREPGCPQTGQALHYRAMCHAMGRKSAFYDFGGTPGRVPEPSHPNYSVWKFKYEFNGTYVSFLGWWRLRLRPVSSRVTDVLRTGVALGRRFKRTIRKDTK